jgi:hypothetical protein
MISCGVEKSFVPPPQMKNCTTGSGQDAEAGLTTVTTSVENLNSKSTQTPLP